MARNLTTGAAVALFCASAAFPQVTFTFTSFDPTGSTETHAMSVNKSGHMVGYFLNSKTGLYAGFQRDKAGKYGPTIQMAGDNTYVTGLNLSFEITGYYYPSQSQEISFTYYKGAFTDFAYQSFQTQLGRNNDNGDLTGIYVSSPTKYPGFLYVAATKATSRFSVSGAAATFGEGVNNKDWVVGSYTTTIPYGTFQSFIRNPTSAKITTFSFPGASQTFAEDINSCNVIAGSFNDATGTSHGFYGKLNSFTQLDYPGATSTYIEGINDSGELVGSYIDSSNVQHGLVAIPTTASCSL